MINRLIVIPCVVAGLAGAAAAEVASVDVEFDRWNYPFNASPGARTGGSTFGAIGNPAFDDRDAQILLGFRTSAIEAGRGASSYRIDAASVTLTTATHNAFVLDPSYDEAATYGDETSDPDAGRPVELFGIGFRNGYSSAGLGETGSGPPVLEESEVYGLPGPPAAESRNGFATDDEAGTGRDVSNSIRNGFDPSPWAIGNVVDLEPGQPVPMDAALTFDIDLNNPNAVRWLQQGLDEGQLYFAVTSLHESVQGSSEGIPAFHLGDSSGASLGQRAKLSIEYEIVPEPSSVVLLGLGLGLLIRPRHKRRRF